MKNITALFIVFICVSGFNSSAQDYKSAAISVQPFEKIFQRSGKVDFKRTLTLSFKSSGYLKKLSVDEGDFFTKKQLLASLDTLELKMAKNAQYAELLQAKRDVKRMKRLVEEDLGSVFDLEKVQTQLETIRSAYKVSYYNLDKAEINAAFDGVVLTRFTELNELQNIGQSVLEVAALENNLVVKIGLTDSEINHVRLGQSVQVSLPGLNSVHGIITKIPVKTHEQGQLYQIEILLKDIKTGQGVVAGQLAQVSLSFSTEQYVYPVSISALIKMDNNGQAVLLVENKNNKSLSSQAFDVIDMDNDTLYLRAQQSDEPLHIITHGWQQLSVIEH